MEEKELRECLRRYDRLKNKKAELEKELQELRETIIHYCEAQGEKQIQAGRYQARLVYQERREYDDQKLMKALPDADLWRMVSKADSGKIAGLIKLNVLSENIINTTYNMKRITQLIVEKR